MANLQRIRIASLGIVIIFCLGVVIPSPDASLDFAGYNQNDDTFQLADDLRISSNEDWETQGWPGNGTAVSPFLIENMSFDSLRIENSDVFFVIQNCQSARYGQFRNTENGQVKDSVFNEHFEIGNCSKIAISNITTRDLRVYECDKVVLSNIAARDEIGYNEFAEYVSIDSSVNITIDRCYFEGFPWGVTLTGSFNCTVQNSTLTDCGYWPAGGAPGQGGGILISSCVGCRIWNNSFIDNYGINFRVYNSEFIEVIENYSDKNGHHFEGCTDCIIINNPLIQGLTIRNSHNFAISGNELGIRGILIFGDPEYFIHTITNNTLEGKPLLYVLGELDSNYTNGEYGQIIVVNSIRVTLKKNKVDIAQQSISIMYSESCVVSGARCTRLYTFESSRTVIQHSEIIGSGILCYYSPETIINNNTIKDGSYGIGLSFNSDNSTITNNTVVNINNHGIAILSPGCRVENNTITTCGRQMGACYETTTIAIVDFAAIRIYSDDCRIVNNFVINNFEYGIWISGKRNTIYRNTIA